MKKFKIAVFVGSLRKESFNLKTAKALIALALESLSVKVTKQERLANKKEINFYYIAVVQSQECSNYE